jgi:SAM-dependent methyltransferase
VEPRGQADSLEIDRDTRGSMGHDFITDRAFYSLFSDALYRCLDISDHEGADVVIDLCGRLPPEMEASVDFIIDGSCLDNIFDPAAAMRNLTRMLKPGGRIVQVNRASRRHNVYVAFALSWFHDYYAINCFMDCQVYLAQWDGNPNEARWDFYHYEPVRSQHDRITYFGQDCWYYPWRDAHAILIAEKSQTSTWDKSPVQFEYRPTARFEETDNGWEIAPQTLSEGWRDDPYLGSAIRFHNSSRPRLLKEDERTEIPSEFLDYCPLVVYCGSIFPVNQHLARRSGKQ